MLPKFPDFAQIAIKLFKILEFLPKMAQNCRKSQEHKEHWKKAKEHGEHKEHDNPARFALKINSRAIHEVFQRIWQSPPYTLKKFLAWKVAFSIFFTFLTWKSVKMGLKKCFFLQIRSIFCVEFDGRTGSFWKSSWMLYFGV